MKHFCFFSSLVLITQLSAAQQADTIPMPDPVRLGGKPLMQALNDRHSSRNFTEKELTLQQLSDTEG